MIDALEILMPDAGIKKIKVSQVRQRNRFYQS